MKQNSLSSLASWILIIGGLVIAYNGLTNVDLIENIFGTGKPIVDAVFGIAAVALTLQMVGIGGKKM